MAGIILFSLGGHYRLFFTDLVHDNVIGTFVNRNHFAGYMELTLSMGIGLMIARLGNSGPSYSGWRYRLVAALSFLISPKMRLRMMLVIMVIALVLTHSRMGNSAFFAAMMIVGAISIPLSWRSARSTAVLILSLVVIDVAIIGTWVGLEKVVSRINNTTMAAVNGAGNDSVEERLLPAQSTLPLIREFPLFGTGAGSFYGVFPKYQPPEVRGYYDHAHNDFAEITSDLGLVGAAVLALLALSTAAVSIKVLYQRRSSLTRGVAFGALMSIVALAIHSTVDFNLHIPANALTFVMIMALAWVAAKLPSQRRTSRS
jgi:O-antigen ligase